MSIIQKDLGHFVYKSPCNRGRVWNVVCIKVPMIGEGLGMLFRAVLWDSPLNMEKGPYQSSLNNFRAGYDSSYRITKILLIEKRQKQTGSGLLSV